MSYKHELKPNKAAFIFSNFVKRAISLIIYIVLLFFIFGASISGLLAIPILLISCLFLAGFYLFYIIIRYKKEKYIFLENKIIHKSGTIFSDKETELVIKNITHVSMSLPFIENKLFQTGNIAIESAGSAVAEVYLSSIENPKKFYEYVEGLMKHNGFKLKKPKLIQQEQPNSLGVFFEVFKNAIMIIFFIFIYIFSFLEDQKNPIDLVTSNLNIVVIGAGLILIWLFFRGIFNFLDLKNRTYNIYSDTITYNEGFLTKNFSYIPIENLADAAITQTMIDRIFGLYDVKISCPGVGNQILFKNMENGQELEKNIDNLISKSKSLIGRKTQTKAEKTRQGKQTKQEKQEKITKQAAYHKNLKKDTKFSAEYRINGKRLLIPLTAYFVIFFLFILIPITILYFVFMSTDSFAIFSALAYTIPTFITMILITVPLIFIWAITFIANIIKIRATKYLVKPNSFEEQYKFLKTKNKEFNIDKITGIVFKESFIDKWFNTCSIHFWSIGSHESINFISIDKSKGLYKKILDKFGIKQNQQQNQQQKIKQQKNKQQTIYKMDSNFDVLTMFKATLPFTLLIFLTILFFISSAFLHSLMLIFPFLIILTCLALIIYRIYYYKRSKMDFYKDYVYFTRGIFFKDYFYVLYDNIKDITTVKYPFSNLGSVRFNVAGEKMVQQQQRRGLFQKKQQTVLASYYFKINYIDDIDNKDELIDLIFYKRPGKEKIAQIEKHITDYAPKPILTAKPDIITTLLSSFSVIIVLGFSFMIPLVMLMIFVPLFIIPILAVFLLIALWLIWAIKVRSYIIQSYRVLAKSGIFYKRQTSIVFNKIDHINYYQGMLNKMFNNGTITVNTTGSSLPELTIMNIPNYKKFHDVLKKYY